MIAFFFIGFFLFLVSSIKFIIFGSGKEFNVVLFNFVEFAVFNYHLKQNIDNNNNIFSDLIMWAFFGLSPHNTNNDSLNNIWVGINNNTRRLSNVNLNNTGFLLNNTTNEYTVKNIVNWVDNNKFILTIITVSTVILVLFIIAWILEIKKRLYLDISLKKKLCFCCKNYCKKKVILDQIEI